ncbi:divergent polysaccharide deacetylase family protein [bacterium]|nr:divergent polysaccharide deacetylase family protein [bacterium]
MAKRLKRSVHQKIRSYILPSFAVPRWQLLLIGTFALLMAALVVLDQYLRKDQRAAIVPPAAQSSFKLKQLTPAERVRFAAVDRVLSEAGIQPHRMSERDRVLIVSVPANIAIAELAQSLIKRAQQLGATIISIQDKLPNGGAEIVYAVANAAPQKILLLPDFGKNTRAGLRRSGKIALIIDDFGYQEQQAVAGFFSLPFLITYAVIPGLPHSEQIANHLHRLGKSVIIHMPMEALDRKVEQNGFELLVRLPAGEIRNRVRKAVKAVPHAEGMNNHMGSRATTNEALLTALFAELKQADLFFVDSQTNNETRAYALAGKAGIAAALNDTFLDNTDTVQHIKQKLLYLADLAGEKGEAIGIGHPYPNTLKALNEVGPQLQQQGITFVLVRDLVRQEQKHVSNLAVQ